MSKRSLALLFTFLGGSIMPLTGWLLYALRHDDPAYVFDTRMLAGITAVSWSPFAVVLAAVGVLGLYERLRSPDIVIVVTPRATPLEAKFLEQDRRLERRERLKGELFALNGEIETFNANLSSDERKAWLHRPGPYGK